MFLKLALLAPFLLPAVAAAQTTTAKVDTIALRFGWPKNLAATVTAERLRIRSTEKTDTSSLDMSYRMQVQPGAGTEMVVRFRDFSFGAADAAEPPAGSAIMEQVAAMVPSYRVSAGGEFLGVHDVAALKARMDSMVGAGIGENTSAEAKALLKSLVSEAYLNAATAQEWNALVGMWVGADLELGELYAFEEQTPVPIIPGATVKMNSEFSVEERVPCVENETEQRCVLIRLYSEPDTASVRTVLQQFMDRVASSARTDLPIFESLSIKSELILVTRPETLVPYRMELTKEVEGTGRLGDERSSFSQIEERRYRYVYR